MAKKHRNRSARRSPHRTATRQSRVAQPSSVHQQRLEDLDLIRTLRSSLRAPDPVVFLLTAAPLVELLSDPTLDEELPEGWAGVLDSLIGMDVAETTALLHVVAALTDDELVRTRLRRVLAERRQPVPGTIATLGQLRVEGTMIMGSDPAGDNLLTGLVWPGGEAMTMVTYLSRRPDVYLKDAFFIGQSLEATVADFRRIVAADGFGPEHAPQPLDPAEARAALERGLSGFDALPGAPGPDEDEAQQWPMCRRLVEHCVSLLPTGGQGYDEHRLLPGRQPSDVLARIYADDDGQALTESGGTGAGPWSDDGWSDDLWSDDLWPQVEVDPALVEDFLASGPARGLPDDSTTREAVHELLAIATEAEGDPLHWCPDVLEWAMTEALPTDPTLQRAVVERAVEVLPGLVTWAGQRSGEIPGVATALTSMMPAWTARLWERWDADPEAVRLRHVLAVAAALGAGDHARARRLLAEEEVGGAQALADLDADPLPDDELDLGRLPEDVHARALEIDRVLVETLDRLGEEHLGTEFRTACRRFLVRAVEREPQVLRRRARADTTAAAVAWTVGRANELVGYPPAPVRSGDLIAAFGLSSPPASRAQTLQRAFGGPGAADGVELRSPDVLVSRRRAALVRTREETGPTGS